MTPANLLIWAAAPGSAVCPCPCAGPAAPAGSPPGEALVHTPSAQAFALNRAGRELYRQRRWDEARARYAEALAADPLFLGPRLNVATAHAQQGNFAEAVREASALVDRAFVPWGREVREAADLAPLHGRPERQRLDAALARAGAAWGAALRGAVLYVARLRPPVRLPAEGVLHLGLEQEIFAWDPASGHHRQVTAEDGRVVGFLATGDGRALFYVRTGKLLRAPGRPDRLRDLGLRRLDLTTMALGPALVIPGDLQRLDVAAGAGGAVRLALVDERGTRWLRSSGDRLEPDAGTRGAGAPVLVIDGKGAAPAPARALAAGGCRFVIQDLRRPGQPPQVQVRAAGRPTFSLPAPRGAGLTGLPFP
jgi:hypothetical protein